MAELLLNFLFLEKKKMLFNILFFLFAGTSLNGIKNASNNQCG